MWVPRHLGKRCKCGQEKVTEAYHRVLGRFFRHLLPEPGEVLPGGGKQLAKGHRQEAADVDFLDVAEPQTRRSHM